MAKKAISPWLDFYATPNRRMIINPYVFSSSPPFDPADFGTVASWLKADAITGLSDGDPVSNWEDSSSSNRDFVQATALLQPVFKVNIKNGLPIVRFDGTSDTMASAGATQSQPITIFAVYKTTDSANQNILSGYRTSAEACVYENGNQAGIYAGSSFADTNTLADWKVTCFVTNGASSSVTVNGNSATTGNPGSLTYDDGYVLSGYAVAAAGPFNGDIGEVIIYNGTCSNISAVISALRSKWNI